MTKPKAHAEYAASSSDRWVNCPASLHLSKSAPEQGSSAAAEEGTIAHELMELCLVNKVDVGFYANEVDDYMNPKFPLDMRVHVQAFVDFVRSLVLPHHELLVEERVHLKFLHPDEAFGTVDVAIIEPFGMIHIIDFKYGQGFVNHKNNSQMIYYALGIAHKLNYDIDEVRTTIYQPRAGSTDAARTDVFNVAKLLSWKDKFIESVNTCETISHTGTFEDEHLQAGSWCKFCPAKVACPALTKSSFEMAKLDFGDVVQPDPKHLTSDQIKKLLDRAAYVKLWIKEVERYAEESIRAGKKISGWGIVPTRAQRVWKDAKKIAAKFPDLEVSDIVSVAQAEKLLKKRMTKEVFEKFMSDNVVAVSGGDKLQQTTNDYDTEWPDDLGVD